MSDTGFVMVNDLGDSNKDVLMGMPPGAPLRPAMMVTPPMAMAVHPPARLKMAGTAPEPHPAAGSQTLPRAQSCVDAPPFHVPGSTIFTAPQYQVTADYGYTDNYAGYNSSLSGCMSEEGNIAPQEGEEVVFKITLPRAHKLYAELQTGNDISGTLYIFENCEGSFSEPDHIKCVDEHTYVTEYYGSFEEIE